MPKVYDGGYLRMRIDVRCKKDGVSDEDPSKCADESHVIDIKSANRKYTEYKKRIFISKEKTSSLGIFIEGINYSGNVYIEHLN